MTVVFSSNDNHAMLLGIALCSLFENKKGDYPLQIFVMDGGISRENKKRFAALERRYHIPIIYLVPDPSIFKDVRVRDRSIAAYFRIAIGTVLPATCHKVLYMDCDIIVRGDIAELFNIDLEGKTVAAVPDYMGDTFADYRRQIAGKDGVYFNSGVMLINLDCWRQLDIESKLFAYIREHPDQLIFDDQDPLNATFSKDYKQLSTKYNFMVAVPEQSSDDPNPLVAHFSGGAKPWYFFSALRHQDAWVYYANLTPWRWWKYRKVMDIYFAQKYGIYPVAWWVWRVYKKIKRLVLS